MANQEYRTRYFLNSVDPEIQSIGDVTPGTWKKDDDATAGFLDRYAQSIRLEGQIADLGQIHSVPSVFARPLLFAQAIGGKAKGSVGDGSRSPNSPVHQAVRSEWRGLMAVFALSDYFGYKIDLKPYTVSAMSDIPDKYEGRSGTNDNYLRIMLRSQLPKPESAWEKWGLIYCDDVLIGATSPWTVVYTPAQYNCPSSVPWVREIKRKRLGGENVAYKVFADPIEYFRAKSGRRELRILEMWLKDLLAEHSKSKWSFKDILLKEELADSWTGAIKREVEAWIKDIPSASLSEKEPTFTIQPGSQYHTETPYRFFLRGCEVTPGEEKLAKSDIFLATRSPDQELLVFSRAQGADPKLRVYGAVFGDQVDVKKLASEVNGDWRTEMGRVIPVGYVIAEDVFFPKKLAEMPLSDKTIRCGSTRFALPLTPAFLKYFEPQDLKPEGRVKLRVVETPRGVTATLELPLRNSKTVTIEKRYNLDDQDSVAKLPEEGFVPAMAVWPDFYDAKWQSYIAVYFGGSERDFPLKLVAAPITVAGVAHPWTSLDGTQKLGRLWESKAPIAGFALKEQRDGQPTVEVGLVLADQRKLKPVDRNSSWLMSLDFGTSNTVVAHLSNDGKREIADLEGRTFLLTSPEKIHPSFKDRVGQDFYPSGTIAQPFITALKDQTKDYSNLDEGRLDYQLVTDVSPGNIETMLTNVKWGAQGGRQDEAPMKAFLTHVVRLIMAQARAECVHTVNLRWSYPLALPSGVKVSMRSFWSTLRQAFCDKDDLSLVVEHHGIPESDAVCRQLARVSPIVSKVRAASAVSIMIDVGGGSTDIGIWSGGKMLDQISAKLAGNDILDQRLLGRQSFEEAFRSVIGLPLSEVNRSKRNIFLNAALSRVGAAVGADPFSHPMTLAAMANPATEPWFSLRSQIYLHFAGITYFVGLAARRFLWDEGDGKNVYIYYGGKAASLLTWLGGPTDVKDILKNIFTAGANSPRAAKLGETVEISGYLFDQRELLPLKHEVAIGCLYEPVEESASSGAVPGKAVNAVVSELLGEPGTSQTAPDVDADPDRSRRIVLGEDQCRNQAGEPLDFFTQVNSFEMSGVQLPSKDAAGSTMIMAFLEGAMKRCGADLNVDLDGLRACRPKTDTTQAIIKQSTSDGKILQPVFISELAGVMHEFAMKAGGQSLSASQ